MIFAHLAITLFGLMIGYYIHNSKPKKPNFQTFNKKVFKKFGKKCDICGTYKNIKVHHTWDKATYPDKMYIVKLARPLCHRHHNGATPKGSYPSFHNWMGGTRVACTMDDYILYRKMIKSRMKFKSKDKYLKHLGSKGINSGMIVNILEVVLILILIAIVMYAKI